MNFTTLNTLLGFLSGVVTIGEAGRGWKRELNEKIKEMDISQISSQDDELQGYLDKLESELAGVSLDCISEQDKEYLTEKYFEQNPVPAQYRKDMEQKLDEVIGVINENLNQRTSTGEKLILHKEDKVLEELHKVQQEVKELKNKQQEVQIADSTKEFQEQYEEYLFWDTENADTPIKLSDVYMIPKSKNGESVLEQVNCFLKDKKSSVLFIEAVAGSGKTSLMSRLAYEYGDSTHYFVKLSAIRMQQGDGLIDALTTYSHRDRGWEDFYRKGNVLFLDGFDEVAGKIDTKKFEEDLRLFHQKKMKVVITSRPGYLGKVAGEYNRTVLDVFDEEFIKEWIYNYAEVKGMKQEEYQGYLDLLDDYDKFTLVEDIISIPIFLYIIVNRKIDVEHINSQTQLFEQVFEQLKEDKIDVKQYELHDYIAQCLGYYLQVNNERMFSEEDIDDFLILVNEHAGQEVTKEMLEHAFSSTFIRSISEGNAAKEFYHKSIQDYFSAKYVYERLKTILKNYSEDDRSECVRQYAGILDKHVFLEEVYHLKFFILKDTEINEYKLKRIFDGIMANEIDMKEVVWQKNIWKEISSDYFKGFPDRIMRKYNNILLNHMFILKDILKEKLYTEGMYQIFFLKLATMVYSRVIMNQQVYSYMQQIWNFFYKEYISYDVFVELFHTENVLERISELGFCQVDEISYSGSNVLVSTVNKITGIYNTCCLENLNVQKSTFHEFFMNHTTIKNTKLLADRIEYSTFTECSFLDTIIWAELKQCNFQGGTMKNTSLCSRNSAHPMKITDTEFTDITFENVTFQYLTCDQKTKFNNVTFKNCRFYTDLRSNILDNCTWDDVSTNSLAVITR